MRLRVNSLLRRTALVLTGIVVVLAALVGIRAAYVFRDRNPNYSLVLDIDARKPGPIAAPLQVGFGRVKINPDISDPNRPVWIAGFAQHRAATNIHDDLWAVACVLDDGRTRLGIVSLDAIGLFHDDVLSVRRSLSPQSRIDYAIVCSTHNHSTPDLMGLWGPNMFRTGVNPQYRQQVIAASARALEAAAAALQKAKVAFHEIPVPVAGLVEDGRKPEVFDPDVRLMHFTNPADGATIGSLVGWADHPETLWSKNTESTADYCGYLRTALESGVSVNGQVLAKGAGGVHLYVNGAIGGLMTTSPEIRVHDPYLNQDFQTPSHEKARAVAHQLAWRILPALSSTNAAFADRAPISIRARTIEIPLANAAFLVAPVLGLFDRGHVRWKTIRTEVALVQIGDASIACIPGEIYPEIVNGGIERAPGGDFDIPPVEVPPVRQLMPGRIKFVFGLANDEIGYIIPKSEWDQKPPYLYGSSRPVYGEINSTGPETARLIHQALSELCRR
jgi:hypothetical protein